MRRLFLISLLVLGLSVSRAEESGEAVLPLSIESFSQMVLERSLRSQSIEDSFNSSKWSWLAGRRSLTWPQLTASASAARSVSDSDTAIETETDSKSATLSLTQPFLTGTNISVSNSWTRTDTEIDSAGSLSTSATRQIPDISATLTQPLYLFVKNDRWRQWKTNNYQWQNARGFYDLDRLNIEFDARSIYYNLQLLLETIEVEKRKFESTRLAYKVTKRLVKRKKLARFELSRVDIFSKQDSRQIQNARINYEQALNEAKDFVLMPSDKKIELTSRLSYQSFSIPLKRLVKLALDKNPSLQVAKNNVRVSELSLQSIKEGTRPSVDLSGTYTKNYSRPIPGAATEPISWDARVDVTWSLFDATQTHLAAKQSQTFLRNTKRSYENESRQLKVSVENAYLDLKRIESQIEDFNHQKISAQGNLVEIRRQYRKRLSSLTDVFDSEEKLRSLELEYLNLLVNFNLAQDRLKVLVGTDYHLINQ